MESIHVMSASFNRELLLASFVLVCLSGLVGCDNQQAQVHKPGTGKTIQRTVNDGISVSRVDPKKLQRAITTNDLVMAETLIAQGANVNARDDNGNVPIHFARSCAAVELLLRNGASVNQASNRGMTPLDRVTIRARKSNNSEFQKIRGLLLAAGARESVLSSAARGDLDSLKSKLVTARSPMVEEALDASLTFNQAASALMILETLDNPRLPDGRPVLAGAVSNLEIVKQIVRLQPDLVSQRKITRASIVGLSFPANGALPLHYAGMSGSVEVTKFLIGCGTDVDCTDDSGVTPFLAACCFCNVHQMQFLASAGADIHAVAGGRGCRELLGTISSTKTERTQAKAVLLRLLDASGSAEELR
ncbi:MAG: ankyrin repeat domain-containing protein [Planctomycetaceae bacterium]